jgi:hypothetical protein
MEKNCLTCGEKLNGRADKKYCNDACKNEFHNRKINRQVKLGMQQLLTAKKNHDILSKIEANGIELVSIKELELSGFDFMGLTGLKRIDSENFLLYCFDFSLEAAGNKYRINKYQSK